MLAGENMTRRLAVWSPWHQQNLCGVFPVPVNFRLVALLQVGSALSTSLAPVHVECNKVMLTSLSMIKLQPHVCNQLSRPKKAHSASPTKATVEKEYLCETPISDSLAHQNYACF